MCRNGDGVRGFQAAADIDKMGAAYYDGVGTIRSGVSYCSDAGRRCSAIRSIEALRSRTQAEKVRVSLEVAIRINSGKYRKAYFKF